VATAPSGPERIASMNEAQQTYADALFPTHYGLARREVSQELDDLHLKMTNSATEADQLAVDIASLKAQTPNAGRQSNLGKQGQTTPDAVEALELEASALFDEAHAAQMQADAAGSLADPLDPGLANKAAADAQKAADDFTRQAERKMKQAQAGIDRLGREKGLRAAWVRAQGRRKAKADHLGLIQEKRKAQIRLTREARDAQLALAEMDKPLRAKAKQRALASAARYTAAEFDTVADDVLRQTLSEVEYTNLETYAKEGGELVAEQDLAHLKEMLNPLYAPEAGRAGKLNNAVTRRMRELEETLDAEYGPVRAAAESAAAVEMSPWEMVQRIMSQPADALRSEDALYDMLSDYGPKGADGSTPVRRIISALEDMTPADIFRMSDAVKVGVRKAKDTGRGYTPGALGQYAGLAPEYKHWEPVLSGFEEFYANALKMMQAEGMFKNWSVWDMLDRGDIASYMHHTLTSRGAAAHLSGRTASKLEASFEKLRTIGGGVLQIDAKGRMTLAENMVRNKAMAGKHYGEAYTKADVNAKVPPPPRLVVAELEQLDESIVNFFEKDPFVASSKYANEAGAVIARRRMWTRARAIRNEIVPENVQREGLVATHMDPATQELTEFHAFSAEDFDKAAAATGKGRLPLTVLDQLAADWGNQAFRQFGEEWAQPLVRVSGPETAAMLAGSKFPSLDKAVFDTMDDLAARGMSSEDIVATILDKHQVTITMEMAASAGNHMYLPADLANFMKAQLRPRLTQGGGKFARAVKGYDNVLSGFRGYVTVIWARFFGRNGLGALNQQAAMIGPRGLLDPTSHLTNAAIGLWKADEKLTVKAFDGVTDITFTNREISSSHINGDQATMMDVTRAAERELLHGTEASFRRVVARAHEMLDLDLRGTPGEVLERLKGKVRDMEQAGTPMVDDFIETVEKVVNAPMKMGKRALQDFKDDRALLKANPDHMKGPAGRVRSLSRAGALLGAGAGMAGASGGAIAVGGLVGAGVGGLAGALRVIPGDKLTQLGGEMAQMQENYFRRLAYINARRKGLTHDHSVWLVEETMFDYSVHGQSWFSYEIMRRLQPFWTFQSKNFVLWSKLLVDHPQKMAAIEATMSGLMHHDSDPEKAAGLSDYQRSRLHFFMGGGAVFAGFGTTFEAFAEMLRPGGDATGAPGGGGIIGGMAPVPKLLMEVMADKSFFFGRNLSDVRGAKELADLPQFMQEFFGYTPPADGTVGKVGNMTPTKSWHPNSKQAALRLALVQQIDITQLVRMYNQAVGNAYVDTVGEMAGGDTDIATSLRMARVALGWKPYLVKGGDEAIREKGARYFEQALLDSFKYKVDGMVNDNAAYGLKPVSPRELKVPAQVSAGRLLPTNYPAP